MKLRVLISAAVVLFLPLWAVVAFPSGGAWAQEEDNGPIRIEVSENGFNNTPGEFRLEVEAGQEVVITFVYGDDDLSFNNPHVIFISGYNIKTDILDRDNPEVTVRFIADNPGEVNFMCVEYCAGHDNLQRGRIVILPSTAGAEPSTGEGGESLLLAAPPQSRIGQPLTLSSTLKDGQGKPIEGARVGFFIGVDFFTSGLMAIGEAVTDDQGVATLDYTPSVGGDIQAVARYRDIEAMTTFTLEETDESLYQPEAGIQLPAPGDEVAIGPESAIEPGSDAPTSVFRLPGGILSWLLLFLVTVMVLWLTYFRVVYQMFHIPIRREIRGTDTRLVPLAGLAIILALGIFLVLILITGPFSHPHLPQ